MRDVFVSYASDDRASADAIVRALERDGLTCWIAPRDITPGANWADAIAAAIEASRTALFVMTANANESRHVAREAERADRHQRPLIPVLIEDIEPRGALAYYFGAAQWVTAYTSPLSGQLAVITTAMRQAIGSESVRRSSTISSLDDGDLVALARSICWDIRPHLVGAVAPEDVVTIEEPKPGQQTKFIDLAAVKAARATIDDWAAATGTSVYLSGEDIAPVAREEANEPIVCVLDALDGTQHWIRGRNLWCTALSLFRRGDDGYKLRVSAIQMADGALYIAREDTQETFLDGETTPLVADTTPVALDQAHVCTVSRRPDQHQILAQRLARGSPFGGLYSFGGNPILIEVVLGNYDAVFQPDASSIGDAQELWDWLPGGHIALRGGCTVFDLAGDTIDVPAAAAAALRGESDGYPFVAAADPALAAAIAAWLEDGTT